MNIDPDYTEKFKPRTLKESGIPRNEHEEMIDRFSVRLNPGRIDDGCRPLTYARLARILQHIPTAELYPFFNDCDHARYFGKLFWHKLKV